MNAFGVVRDHLADHKQAHSIFDASDLRDTDIDQAFQRHNFCNAILNLPQEQVLDIIDALQTVRLVILSMLCSRTLNGFIGTTSHWANHHANERSTLMDANYRQSHQANASNCFKTYLPSRGFFLGNTGSMVSLVAVALLVEVRLASTKASTARVRSSYESFIMPIRAMRETSWSSKSVLQFIIHLAKNLSVLVAYGFLTSSSYVKSLLICN